MPGTRVYTELTTKEDIATGKKSAEFTIKNISREPLNISPEELTERFVRGEESRTTEGSGLGLSIARSLTELMGGSFSIYLDGDLFRVTLEFPIENLCL
jgi:signal transduction histidine kinase